MQNFTGKNEDKRPTSKPRSKRELQLQFILIGHVKSVWAGFIRAWKETKEQPVQILKLTSAFHERWEIT
jgi:hypothetical protein